MTSSWRALFSSVPAYFIIEGWAGWAWPDLQLVDEPLGHRPERHAVDVEAGDVGAQHRIVAEHVASNASPSDPDWPPRPMPLIISRSWPSRYLATSQPLLISPTDLVLGHLHVVEEGLAEGRIAGDQQDRPGRDAGARHVEQQEADPLMLGRGRIGAHQAEDPVGLVGIAGPDLLAVDQPVIALVLALGLQAGEVGAGAGLGIALAPADLAAGDLGQDSACFCSSLPYLSKAGPSIEMPKLISGLRAPIRAISCCRILVSAGESPPPPYSLGQSGTVQPRAAMASIQLFLRLVLEDRRCGRPSRRRSRRASARASRAGNSPPARRAVSARNIRPDRPWRPLLYVNVKCQRPLIESIGAGLAEIHHSVGRPGRDAARRYP